MAAKSTTPPITDELPSFATRLQLAGEAEGWTGSGEDKPKPGDEVTGRLIMVDRVESQWGGYPMITLLKGDGSAVNIHAFHATLKNRLFKLRPQLGDEITVKYIGVRPHKKDKDRKVHIYAVTTPGATEGALPWTEDDERATDDAEF